ncbi:MAG: DUF2080 family transposase-associated protein [Nanoarchaeota archaeon]|nr:DUF2080 family transposase-associated protein [Patescibacteria group bacterium]MBU1604762.1 DUF2080 family transposase-associated protein [Nanoarchaeota archaeon]MBU2443242.1 DUF2080 family transposase-associated protein [Nanoarchaeota archaeon]MBU2639160.1 DUF2080 family transposase-associated protein [Nanoarchaeota archaeon]
MRKVKFSKETELKIFNIEGFFKRKVTKFGNSAKVSCPKEHLGKTVYLVVVKNGSKKTTGRSS